MPEVFIIHADDASETAFVRDHLVPALALPAAQVRLSSRLPVGQTVVGAIEEAVQASHVVVLVLSPAFLRDRWASFAESIASHAAVTGGRLAPLVVADCTVPLRLDMRTVLDCRDPAGHPAAFARLRETVHSVDARPRAPVPIYASRIHNAPSIRARTLFGRDADLHEIAATLLTDRSVCVAASVEGLGGIGKTELAIHVVYNLATRGEFPGGIYWIDAEQPDLTPIWGGAIADSLGIAAGPSHQRAATARRHVEQGAPALVVLDNVNEWSVHVPGPRANAPHVATLVTTRRQFLGGTAFHHRTLGFLDDAAAREFLVEVAGRDVVAEAGSEDLVKQLGGYTLAIELAGAYLRSYGITPAEYLARLLAGKPVQAVVVADVGYSRTVTQALDANWGRLSGSAQHALRVAACFADADAGVALLNACGVDDDALRELARFHLVTMEHGRWAMHRLVRQYAYRDDDASAREAFLSGIRAQRSALRTATVYRLYRSEKPHLLRAVEVASAAYGTDDRVAVLMSSVAIAARAGGDLRLACDLGERALACFLAVYGAGSSEVATIRSNLALALRDLGDYPRARGLFEEALASDLVSFGEAHAMVSLRRVLLGELLAAAGDLEAARVHLERAVAADELRLGPEHPDLAFSRTGLASALHGLGDLRRARDLLEWALTSELARGGDQPRDIATMRSSLALVLVSMRADLPRARHLLEQALESNLLGLGEDHPDVAHCRFNLASILTQSGVVADLPRARHLLELALESYVERFGDEHPRVRKCKDELNFVVESIRVWTRLHFLDS